MNYLKTLKNESILYPQVMGSKFYLELFYSFWCLLLLLLLCSRAVVVDNVAMMLAAWFFSPLVLGRQAGRQGLAITWDIQLVYLHYCAIVQAIQSLSHPLLAFLDLWSQSLYLVWPPMESTCASLLLLLLLPRINIFCCRNFLLPRLALPCLASPCFALRG